MRMKSLELDLWELHQHFKVKIVKISLNTDLWDCSSDSQQARLLISLIFWVSGDGGRGASKLAVSWTSNSPGMCLMNVWGPRLGREILYCTTLAFLWRGQQTCLCQTCGSSKNAISHMNIYILQGGYIFSLFWFRIYERLLTDLHETLWKGVAWVKNEQINTRGRIHALFSTYGNCLL